MAISPEMQAQIEAAKAKISSAISIGQIKLIVSGPAEIKTNDPRIQIEKRE